MNLFGLFDNKYKKWYREAKQAYDSEDWDLLITLFEEASATAEAESKTNSRAYKSLRRLYMNASDKIWAIEDIDPSFVPTAETLTQLLSFLLKPEIERYGSSRGSSSPWVYFVGYSNAGEEEIHDVGSQVLAELSVIPLQIRQWSKSEFTDDGVFDVETGQQGTRFSVDIVGWLNENSVKIRLESHTGGRYASGYWTLMERTNDHWKFGQTVREWIA